MHTIRYSAEQIGRGGPETPGNVSAASTWRPELALLIHDVTDHARREVFGRPIDHGTVALRLLRHA